MRTTLFLIAALMLAPVLAAAQPYEGPVSEVRAFGGVFLPAGHNHDEMTTAALAGAQVVLQLRETIHLLGTMSWSPSSGKLLSADNKLDIYQYDVGAEFMAPKAIGNGWHLGPFVGLGAGARTLHLADVPGVRSQTRTNFAGYGALGAELKAGRFGVRVEARDYVSQFKGLVTTENATTRNDVEVLGGLALHIW